MRGTAAKQEGIAWTELLKSYRELGQDAPPATRTMVQNVEANLVRMIASKGPTETTGVHCRP